MAMTTLFTYGPANVDTLLATTISAIRKTLADNVFLKIPLLAWLEKKSKITLSGGASIVVPLLTGSNTTAASYSGYGIIDTTPQEGMTAAQYSWRQYAASISISGGEEAQNSGESAIIKLLEAKITQAEKSLRNTLDIDMWRTTQTSTRIQALPILVDTTTTVADVSRSANTFWQAQVTASGSFAARGLSDMRAQWNTILNQTTDNGAPDVIIATQAVYEFYEGTMQPQIRYQHEQMADAGFKTISFKGAPVMFDTNVPSGNLFMLRSDNLQLVVHSARNFVNTTFVKPANQDARVAQILLMAALVSDNPRKLGKLTGITA